MHAGQIRLTSKGTGHCSVASAIAEGIVFCSDAKIIRVCVVVKDLE